MRERLPEGYETGVCIHPDGAGVTGPHFECECSEPTLPRVRYRVSQERSPDTLSDAIGIHGEVVQIGFRRLGST